MAEMLKKGDRVGPKAIIDYLTDSYKFVIHLAKMSKPLYYVGAGVMESLGGTAMAVSGMPVVYESATLSFPEACTLSCSHYRSCSPVRLRPTWRIHLLPESPP